jgi:hypothetical protein
LEFFDQGRLEKIFDTSFGMFIGWSRSKIRGTRSVRFLRGDEG